MIYWNKEYKVTLIKKGKIKIFQLSGLTVKVSAKLLQVNILLVVSSGYQHSDSPI